VQIVAYCPECRSRYQLQDELRGRRMRCPNTACRSIFTVVEAEEPATAENDGPAEIADWRSAPPPVQHENGAPAKPVRAEPSRRKRTEKRDAYPVAQPAPPSTPQVEHTPIVAPPKRGLLWVAFLLLLVIGLVGGGGWLIVNRINRSEDSLRTQAEKDYADGSFRAAAKKYEELGTKFSRSGHAAEYHFLAELANVRDMAGRSPPEPLAALEAESAFVQKFGRDPLLQIWRGDLASSIAATAGELVAQAQTAVESAAELNKVPEMMQRATTALGLVERYPGGGADAAALTGKIDAVGATLAATRARQDNVAQIVALLNPAKPDLDAARGLIRRFRLENDPAVVAALAEAERLARDVKFESLDRQALPAAPPEATPSLMLEPPTAPGSSGQSEVVLAVARGLLYALDGRSGKRLWIGRVGLDAGGLPLRIPPRGEEPELVVVAGTDPPSLTARELRTGAVRWHQPLEAPVLGRPVLAGNRLLAPTSGSTGFVYDLDPRDGHLRGRFATHQSFAAGGAFDAATGRLYVPTHAQYVYVFSFSPAAEVAGPGAPTVPVCEGLLPTGHAPGSLRGEPIVVSGEAGVDVPRYLVLGEADGIEAMKLRAFRLLDKPTTPGPTADVRLPGWSWFAPYQDPEKMVLVTDAGALGIVGIQQKGNTDAPLFPLLGRDAPPIETARSATRAELVHAEEYGFWALAAGKLQHWRLGLDRRVGPKLTPAWNSSLTIGSPVHASQVSRDRSTLYLVTQTDSPAGHWATAVDARTGRERWRRSLGLTCQGDPIELGGAVVTVDPSGALWRFDAATTPETAWTPAGTRVFPEIRNLSGTPTLLRSADGRQVIEIACKNDGAGWQLDLRQLGAHGQERTATISIPASIAGTPAVNGTAIVVPLADGSLARAPLTAESRRDVGPNWRALGASSDARSHVLAWRSDEYLVSDGNRRLMQLRWSGGTQYELATAQALELNGKLIGLPARLPDAIGAPLAIVADTSGIVSLIRGPSPRVERTWRVGSTAEPITSGPWIVGERTFLVVNHRKLVALDPMNDQPAWTYETPGDGIVFAPTLIDSRLIVVDQAGTYTALDPATGAALGPGFHHPAIVAPASAPVAFGAGRAFAPLTDGSALVLNVADLVAPK
jgi:outer membrane protein assembly factor BamB